MSFRPPVSPGRFDGSHLILEVDLCGHATLATTHALGSEQRYVTRSGELHCVVQDDGRIEMAFPADPIRPVDSADIEQAFSTLTVVGMGSGVSDLLIEVESASQVRDYFPDFDALLKLPYRGIIVTAPSDSEEFDVASRCFFPTLGIPEDPVTGSAHCTIAAWWSDRLGSTLRAQQLSARGGAIAIEIKGDNVVISGHAVTTAHGSLRA